MSDRRLLDAHMRTSLARSEALGALLTRAGRTLGYDSDRFVELAVDAVLSAQTTQALATWSLWDILGERADPLSRRIETEPPVEVMIGAATHGGTPLETVYRRPAKMLAAELAANAAVEGAFALAIGKVDREVALMADADLMVAGRKAEQTLAAVDRRVVGYRRVPNSGACDWCLYIATQRYKVDRLAPAHRDCHCGTEPIYGIADPGPVLDPEKLAEIKRRGVPTRYGDRKRAARVANEKVAEGGPVPPIPPPTPPPVAAPKPRGDYSKAKTTKEVVAEWSRVHPDSDFVPGGWTVKTARHAAETMEDLFERFPLEEAPVTLWGQMKNVFPTMKIQKGTMGLARSRPAVYRPDGGGWVFSGSDSRLGLSTKSMTDPSIGEKMREIGHWSTGHPDGVLVHEYGHHIGYEAELALLRRELPNGPLGAELTGNRTGKELWERAVVDRLNRDFGSGSPMSWGEWTFRLYDEVSKYGKTNGREALAESFAEYVLEGEKCRPMARAIAELALELIEEGKALRP